VVQVSLDDEHAIIDPSYHPDWGSPVPETVEDRVEADLQLNAILNVRNSPRPGSAAASLLYTWAAP
jgi:hypothetical protein